MSRISGYEFVINLDARQAINSINTFSNRVKVMKRVMEANFGELSRSVGSLSAYGQRLHDLSRQEDEAMHAMEGLRKTLANQRAEQAKLRAEFEKGAKAEDQYKKGSDKLDNQIANTERRMANVQIKLASINQDMEESTRMIRRLSTGIDALTNHNDGLIRSYKTLETSLRESGKFYAANRTHVAGLQQSVKGLSKQYKAESLVLGQAREHHEKLTTEYQKQSATVSKLIAKKRANGQLTEKENADLVEAQGKLQGLTERMGESSKAIGQQTEQLHKTAKALRDAQKAAGSLGSTKLGSFFKAAGSKMDIVKENSQNLRNWASNAKSTAVVVGGALASMGAGAGALVKKASDVQNKFIEVRNLMETAGEGTARSTRNMNKMMSQAVALSSKYGASQEEIGEQYEELIKRGYSGTAALGSMNSMLKASKASGDDFNDVVRVSSTVMDSFGLRVENATKMAENSARVNNAIASAADRTSTSFKDLGTGLAYVSGTAHNVGYSVEETAAALGELSNRGMDGTRAGTGLRKVLTSLTGPTESAEKAFKNIGLSTKDFTDQKGDLLSIDKVFQLINSHLSGKSGTEKAAFYKAVFGATGMEAAQDLANTAAEVGKTDQSITTLIKHIRQDETGNYIDRLAKKNMQSTKNQLAAFKQTMWAMGIMIGQELMPTVNQVTKSIAKWVVSKEGRQSIQEVATMTKSIMTSITSRSGSIMKFLAGTIEGIHDVGKATSVVLSPVGKLIDFLSGKKGDGAKWMGRIAGWLLAGVAAVKVFNGLFGWTIAGFRDLRAMAKNGLFGSKLSEEQVQLAGINEQLGITNNLLQQINQNPINPTEYSQNVSKATTYKAEHGPAGTKPTESWTSGSSVGGYSFTENPKSGEAPKTNFSYKGEEGKSVYSYAQKQGENIGKGVSEGVAKSGAAEQTGKRFAEATGQALEKSGGLAKGIEGAAGAAAKSKSLWSKGLAIGGHILNGLNYAFLAYDLGKTVIEMLTSSSKKVRQSSAWNLGGTIAGAGIGMLLGNPMAGAGVGSLVGMGLGKIDSALSKNQSKQVKANRMAGLGYGAVAGMGLGVPLGPGGMLAGAALGAMLGNGIGGVIPTKQTKAKKKRSVLTADQKKEAEGLGNTLKDITKTDIKLHVGVDKKSLKNTESSLLKLYSNLRKAADKSSKKRKSSEKSALDYMLKIGAITKKQYSQAIKDITQKDKDRRKSNKDTYNALKKDTEHETKDRTKIWSQYYKDLKKKGMSQKWAEIKRNNALALVDAKYATSREKNEQKLAKNLEKTWSTSNNKQLSKMKSLVKQKGKLSEKEAGKIINESAKAANKTISNANKQRNKIKKTAEQEYNDKVKALKAARDDSKTITNAEYKAAKKTAEKEKKAKVDAATDARDRVVRQAKKQHDKTIEYAEGQSKEVSKHIVRQGNNSIDSYNAQAVNAHGITKSILEAWNSFLKFFGQKPIPIAKSTPKQSAHISANSYATGGVARNGLALVGEAGPELVYSPYADQVRFVGAGGAELTHLEAGEHVLNARDTKRLLSGSYFGTLPGYAKGTSVLSDWLGKIKKASDKVLKKIPKAIKNMLKAPAKWVTNLFSTKWDAPKTAYPFAKINEMSMLKETFKKNIVKTIKGIFKKANNALEDAYDDVATGGTFSPSMIRKAAAQMHVHPSDAFIKNLQAVIQNESGGRNIVQQIHDVNSGGNEAAGILQYTPGTFAAYAMPGHRNRMNPYDQLLAFFNNSDWANSIGWTRIWGVRKMEWLHSGPQGHRRYANGGLVDTEQLAHVAEGNNPEMIIPLSPLKRPRALQLTKQVVDKFNAESSQGVQHTNTNVEDKLDVLIDQFTSVLGQLKQVISNQDNPVPAIMGTAQAYSALNKYKKNQELKTKMLY